MCVCVCLCNMTGNRTCRFDCEDALPSGSGKTCSALNQCFRGRGKVFFLNIPMCVFFSKHHFLAVLVYPHLNNQ
jgi:hypothetical protein